jgi:hypothetical protein
MDETSLKPIHLGPQHGQFPRLQDVVEASPTPEITTLLKAEAVDIPACINPLDERSVLRGVGFGKVPVGASNQHLASTNSAYYTCAIAAFQPLVYATISNGEPQHVHLLVNYRPRSDCPSR